MPRPSNPDATVRILDAYDADGNPIDLATLFAEALAGVTLTIGEVEVKNDVGNAVPVNADPTNRFVGGKTPVVATVTAPGDTTIHTPAPGHRIRLYWVSAINDPDEATTPLIKVSIGALECYRAYAMAHWEPFEGEADEELVVNLSAAGSVAVTAHIIEVAP